MRAASGDAERKRFQLTVDEDVRPTDILAARGPGEALDDELGEIGTVDRVDPCFAGPEREAHPPSSPSAGSR